MTSLRFKAGKIGFDFVENSSKRCDQKRPQTGKQEAVEAIKIYKLGLLILLSETNMCKNRQLCPAWSSFECVISTAIGKSCDKDIMAGVWWIKVDAEWLPIRLLFVCFSISISRWVFKLGELAKKCTSVVLQQTDDDLIFLLKGFVT